MLANNLLGTQIKLIPGYKGVTDIFLAMQQGEVQGTGMILASLLAKEDWMRDGKARILVHFGNARLREIPDVPAAIEFARDDTARQMLQLYALKYKATYPFLVPPDTPRERLQILRDGFDALMKDPAFAAEARKFGINIDPMRGEEIASIISTVEKAPQDVVDRLRTYLHGQ
jgi:tripartite-type tricarboxylate transporter receptor subunit TctC